MPQKFKLFKNRAESLLKRWEDFSNKHDGEDERCIKGFLSEITDDYTKYLVEDVLDPRD